MGATTLAALLFAASSLANAIPQQSPSSVASFTNLPTQFAVPLTGPAPSQDTEWGVSVAAITRPFDVSLYNLTFGQVDSADIRDINASPGDQTVDLDGPAVTLDADYPSGFAIPEGAIVYAPTSDASSIALGQNNQVATAYFDQSGTTVATSAGFTFPVGFNYGASSPSMTFSGSVTFGGMFDTSRIGGTNWSQILQPNDDSSAPFSSPEQLPNQVGVGSTTANGVSLDPSNPQVIIPASLNTPCGNDLPLVIGITSGSSSSGSVTITIPGALLSGDRCTVSNDNTVGLTLGVPFFQAAYTYIDMQSNVFVVQATTKNARPNLANFDPTATLTPAGPAPAGSSPAASSSAAGSSSDSNTSAAAVGFRAPAVGVLGMGVAAALGMIMIFV